MIADEAVFLQNVYSMKTEGRICAANRERASTDIFRFDSIFKVILCIKEYVTLIPLISAHRTANPLLIVTNLSI